jgi:hypothetical protein
LLISGTDKDHPKPKNIKLSKVLYGDAKWFPNTTVEGGSCLSNITTVEGGSCLSSITTVEGGSCEKYKENFTRSAFARHVEVLLVFFR